MVVLDRLSFKGPAAHRGEVPSDVGTGSWQLICLCVCVFVCVQVLLRVSVHVAISLYSAIAIAAGIMSFLLPIETKGREMTVSPICEPPAVF